MTTQRLIEQHQKALDTLQVLEDSGYHELARTLREALEGTWQELLWEQKFRCVIERRLEAVRHALECG